MTLTQVERDGPLWFKLRAHLTERISMLRAKNDNKASAEDTACLRGQIAECKALMALGEEPIVF